MWNAEVAFGEVPLTAKSSSAFYQKFLCLLPRVSLLPVGLIVSPADGMYRLYRLQGAGGLVQQGAVTEDSCREESGLWSVGRIVPICRFLFVKAGWPAS